MNADDAREATITQGEQEYFRYELRKGKGGRDNGESGERGYQCW